MTTMLEKLGFQELVEETLTVKRKTRIKSMSQFVLAIVLTIYVGFSRLNDVRFLQREPMLIGFLKVLRLPPQCTFWRFLTSLRIHIAAQILQVQRHMTTNVGGGTCRIERSHAGHRDCAHLIWPADGWPQGLQPQQPGQEKL